MKYYLDESGNTGDISLTNPSLDFDGQPIFTLACIGTNEPSTLEEYFNTIKTKHNVLSDDLQLTNIYKRKPKFIKDLFKFVESENLPFFIEVVDKKYYLSINIVNNYLMAPYLIQHETQEDIDVRKIYSNFIYHSFSNELFLEFANACKEPSNTKIINLFNSFIDFIRKIKDEAPLGMLDFLEDGLDDFYCIQNEIGNEAYKKFLPIPDVSKKEYFVWILPHFSSFTNVYARINLCHNGDLSNIVMFHDEQAHFDKIIEKAKADAELYSELSCNSFTPVANYNFKQSAALFFTASKNNTGIQVADVLSGFVMRYVRDFISNNEICAVKKESFDILFNNGDDKSGIGMNLVLPSHIIQKLFSQVGCA